MKKTIRKLTTINITKEDFDYLKKFCERHGLNLPKWLVITARQKIDELENKDIKTL